MKSYNCIIIDDDEIDRITTTSFAKKFGELNIVGVFSSAEAALPAISSPNIDILFVDIDMPGLTGLEFRKIASHIPVCIFITAHPEHALESFELETLDFIVKPIRLNRFSESVRRISEFMEMRHKASLFEASLGADTIYVKEGHKQIKIKLHEISHLEALKDYTLIVTSAKRHCVHASIGALLKEISFLSFVRIHRSYAVQKNFIQTIGTSELMLNNSIMIPIGRTYKENLAALH